MSNASSKETINVNNCLITLCRIEGPEASEIYLSCAPAESLPNDAEKQTEAMYEAINATLETQQGSSNAYVLSETFFVRDIANNITAVRDARQRVQRLVQQESQQNAVEPALTEIEQAPLNELACLEIAVHAIIPKTQAFKIEQLTVLTNPHCKEYSELQGLKLQIGNETRLLVGGIYGSGDNATKQTKNMFELAEKLLQHAGMNFSDVVRTWIYLREMERDYQLLNQARREFFAEHSIEPVPASTGIEGGMVNNAHDLCLGIYAIKAEPAPERTVMTSPTLNEAPQYGADFVRGMKVVDSNKIALLVSGTASIDEEGRTAHIDDFEAQADRMLLNIAALLEKQGASFEHIVSAISYLKNIEDADRLKEKFKQAGFEEFPNVLVKAQVCRSNLLCETEVLAVLPR